MASYQYVYHMDGVSKTYPGGKKVFENIRLNFLPGVKIGVVGVNGSGKSTLLKIMAGQDKDFQGEAWAAAGAKVGYLPQEPQLDPALSVRGNVMQGVAAKQAILDRYNELAMNYSDETAEEMAQLQDQIDSQNLWDLDAQVDISMEALRCPPDDADVTTLSGGEARRVALCRLLLEAPDMLLLDEPTNHLDAETIAWLQNHLIDYKGTILIVTHDRYFLAVHELLSRDDLDHVSLIEIAKTLGQHQRQSFVNPSTRIQFLTTGDDVFLSTAQATQVALVLNELMANAVEHGFKNAQEGEVHITIETQTNTVDVYVSNSGDPLPPGFSLENANLGLKIVQSLAQSLGGSFTIQDKLGWTVSHLTFVRSGGE